VPRIFHSRNSSHGYAHTDMGVAVIFIKSVLGGILASSLVWFAVVSVYMWKAYAATRAQGTTGLIASANGWDYLLHSPWVVILLTLAFGIGLYVTAK
jgi:hypothetical protein